MTAHLFEGREGVARATRCAKSLIDSAPRLLFVTWRTLGFGTLAEEVYQATKGLEGIQSIHVVLDLPVVHRSLATSRFGGNWTFSHPAVRQRVMFRAAFARSIRDLFTATDWTAIHLAPMSTSGLSSLVPAKPVLSFSSDTTSALRGPSHAGNPLLRSMDATFISRATFIAPMSELVETSFRHDHLVSADELLLTPPAVQLPSEDETPRRASPPRLMFVGNDWSRKGGPELVAWHQRHFGSRCELHVIGTVPKRSKRQLQSVYFHGRLPRDEIRRDWLPTASALVLPSRLEMTPWVIVEAASARVPVIATVSGSVANMVVDGRTGFLLHADRAEEEFARSVRALIEDPGLVERLGYAGYEHALRHHNANTVYPRLVGRMLEAPPRR